MESGIKDNIFITGNTVIDALFYIKDNCKLCMPECIDDKKRKFILLTVHRRENWGERLNEIIKGILVILKSYPEISIVIPMHKNNLVREPLKML